MYQGTIQVIKWFLEVCDLAMRRFRRRRVFFPCVTDSEFEFRKFELHIFPQKTCGAPCRAKKDGSTDGSEGADFFLRRFCEKDE